MNQIIGVLFIIVGLTLLMQSNEISGLSKRLTAVEFQLRAITSERTGP